MATASTGPDLSGRHRIMDVAAGLFVQQGFAATSLRGIAEACGIKAASVYYHFESKDELLEQVLRRGIAVMDEAFGAVESGTDEAGIAFGPHHGSARAIEAGAACDAGGAGEARRLLGAHVRAHLGALFEHGPYTAAHVTTFHTAPPAVRDAIVPVRDAYEARWTALLEGMVADGVLAPVPPVPLRRLILMGAMNAAVEWFDPSGDVSLDDLAQAVADQFWFGAG